MKIVQKRTPKQLNLDNIQDFDITKFIVISNMVFEAILSPDSKLFANEPGFVIMNNHYYVLIGKTHHGYYILQSWCHSFQYYFIKNFAKARVYFLHEKFAMTNRTYDEIDISGDDVAMEEY
jgi:hypothetical protein